MCWTFSNHSGPTLEVSFRAFIARVSAFVTGTSLFLPLPRSFSLFTFKKICGFFFTYQHLHFPLFRVRSLHVSISFFSFKSCLVFLAIHFAQFTLGVSLHTCSLPFFVFMVTFKSSSKSPYFKSSKIVCVNKWWWIFHHFFKWSQTPNVQVVKITTRTPFHLSPTIKAVVFTSTSSFSPTPNVGAVKITAPT